MGAARARLSAKLTIDASTRQVSSNFWPTRDNTNDHSPGFAPASGAPSGPPGLHGRPLCPGKIRLMIVAKASEVRAPRSPGARAPHNKAPLATTDGHTNWARQVCATDSRSVKASGPLMRARRLQFSPIGRRCSSGPLIRPAHLPRPARLAGARSQVGAGLIDGGAANEPTGCRARARARAPPSYAKAGRPAIQQLRRQLTCALLVGAPGAGALAGGPRTTWELRRARGAVATSDA